MATKKTAPALIVIAIVALAAIAVAVFVLVDERDVFTGTRTKNHDAYILQFSEMNQTDSHTLALTAGDELEVAYTVEKGRLDLSIGIDGRANVYTGTDLTDSGAFAVIADEPGDYTVTLTARYAAGSVRVAKANS